MPKVFKGASAAALAGFVFLLVSCAPAAPGGNESDVAQAQGGVQMTWLIDMDCSVCHASQQESYDDTSCAASFHKTEECVSCHADEEALQTVHEGKTAESKAPARLKKTEVPDELCFSCHYGNREALIAATESTASVTDSKGTARNPHDTEGVAEHEGLACSGCHNMHNSEDVATQAKKQCLNCHHSDVFECYTCHE